ncbi:MAG: AAA family ATPase [Gammaproteobacteria bacterium]|nr:AAA family ATPase [Gammaproteobacteria bacterium]
MYLEYYNLKELPFRLSPDPKFLYLSKAHKRALACMDYSLWNEDGFVVITGEIGIGKTTLIRKITEDLADNVLLADIYQTQFNEVELLQAILMEFGFKPFGISKVELLGILKNFLLEQNRNHKRVVIAVDEAQNLSRPALEEVRMLSSLEVDTQKVMNVILVGQPEFSDMLDLPELEQLVQRARFRFHLGPLTKEETAEFIEYRLSVAGSEKPNLFPAATISVIYEYTGGIPRLINTLCDTVLTAGYVDSVPKINVSLVKDAVKELGWEPYQSRRNKAKRKVKISQEKLSPDSSKKQKVIAYFEDQKIGEYILEKESIMIGRSPLCDIRFNDNKVSGFHAQIYTTHNMCMVIDLNSRNGVIVNDKKINKAYVNHNDEIHLTRFCKLVYQNENVIGESGSMEDDDEDITYNSQ